MNNSKIVQLLADGYTVKEISVELNINKRTLEKRILDMRDRFICKTVSQLVANFIRKGLIQ